MVRLCYRIAEHSAVYEYQKLKDRLMLMQEEEEKIPLLPKKVYDYTSEENKR